MELQWPLILFTTLVAWSAGLFGSQAVAALRGEARKAQTASWACAAVLLVAGGVAVFFHLEHWERIFNGFGNPTSGITQELICIVILAVVAVVYLAMLRKSGEGAVPKWCAWCAIAASALLVVVMAHSYVMAARPAWDSLLQIGSLLGASLMLGPLTLGFLMALCGDDAAPLAKMAFISVVVGAVLVAAYAAAVQASGGSFADVGYCFDPTRPTQGMVDAGAAVASQAPLLWLGGVGLGAAIPLACVLAAWRRPALWKGCGLAGALAAAAGAVCLRAAFYACGLSVFMFY